MLVNRSDYNLHLELLTYHQFSIYSSATIYDVQFLQKGNVLRLQAFTVGYSPSMLFNPSPSILSN